METLILAGLLIVTYLMVVAKRMSALIRNFRYQSFFLFMATLGAAFREKHLDLYIVSGLLLILKVIVIPFFLEKIIRKIKANDQLGCLIHPQLSIICALILTYCSWTFSRSFVVSEDPFQAIAVAVALTLVWLGAFIMIFRIKALTQVVGLLVMENGIFLTASTVIGGMPFFIEIAIFFDIFVSVLILGTFVYKINKLFTHIDVNKLSQLKG